MLLLEYLHKTSLKTTETIDLDQKIVERVKEKTKTNQNKNFQCDIIPESYNKWSTCGL